MREKEIIAAVVSDVHGNLPALEAVLADCDKQSVDRVWNLGDFVGYVPFPNEVIELLRKRCQTSIIGNYDLKVLSFTENSAKWKIKKSDEKYISFKWNSMALTKESRRYLEGLPKTKRLEVGGVSVLLTHGSQASEEEGLIADTPAERLRELAKMAGTDVVLCGHTHKPMIRREGRVLFVNAGSVGRPEGDRRATYAILRFANGRVRADHRLVEYDIEQSAEAIRAAKLPEGYIDVITEAASLDTLKNRQDKTGAKKATDEEIIESALALAKECKYEQQHTHQVERLAMSIFDQLGQLHKLGEAQRFLLRCAAILHDIGWVEGQKGHHKTALRIIMNSPVLRLDFERRRIVGLVARYHRKALPKEKHTYFRDLDARGRDIVCKLAGVLRVADGLDRSHESRVKDISCGVDRERIKMVCRSGEPLDGEFALAAEKGTLFEQVFGRKLALKRKPD
jgi:putative phosphoesterase